LFQKTLQVPKTWSSTLPLLFWPPLSFILGLESLTHTSGTISASKCTSRLLWPQTASLFTQGSAAKCRWSPGADRSGRRVVKLRRST
jgi:hypothetical protein